MSGPAWLADFFAGVMIVVALYSASRLVASMLWSRPTHADTDLSHILMGVAMAGMLVSAINPIPSVVWECVFGAVAVFFTWRCGEFIARHGAGGRDEDHVHHLSHYVTHVVMALAMLYMYLAATPSAGGAVSGGMGMGGASGTTADFVGFPLLFLFVLLGSAVWELDGAGRWAPAWSQTKRSGVALELAGAGSFPTTTSENVASSAMHARVATGQGIHSPHLQSPEWLAPGLKATCHVAMCVTMGYMLIVML